jgi:hypothetical protein
MSTWGDCRAEILFLSVMITLSASDGGGGGGVASTSPPVISPGPTPAPTPTPPTYTKFANLTGNQDFQNAADEQRSVTDMKGQRTDSFALANFGSGITSTDDSASDRYTLTALVRPSVPDHCKPPAQPI